MVLRLSEDCPYCGGEIETYPYSPVELYGYGCKDCGAQWERKDASFG